MTDIGSRRLDPEVAVLLGEIAQDRRTRLLTAERLDDIAGFRELSEPVSAIEASKAERHLLDVYREDVAWLLRQASGIALRLSPSDRVCEYVDVDERLGLLSETTLRERIAEASGWIDEGALPDIASALSQLSGALPLQPEYAERLAAMSQMLLPRDDTRVYLALAWSLQERTTAASDLLERVIATGATARLQSIAWNNLGSVLHRRGQFDRARTAHRESVNVLPRPAPIVNWLLNACLLEDRVDALRAATVVDEHLPANHPAVDACLPLVSAGTPSTRPRRDMIEGLEDEVGETARRILDAAF